VLFPHTKQVVGTVLLNIVVAVLLDEFIDSVDNARVQEEQQKREKEKAEKKKETFCLDPVLETLSKFDTSQDLRMRIRELYRKLDIDRSETLSFQEFAQGMHSLK